MKNTVFVDENIPLLERCLCKYFNIMAFSGRLLKNDDLIRNNAEALIVRSTTKVNSDLLHGTKIKVVGTATAGTDHIDIDYLNKNNIEFHSAPGANANSVAEYLVFSIAKWAVENNIDIKNKTIGIIGVGNIGKRVVYYAGKLGLKIIVNDPPLKDSGHKFPENCSYMEIDELITNSDIITNHVPMNKTGKYKTLGLINEERVNNIRNNTLLIHASRGGVLNEKALKARLKLKEITAVIDVWDNEPHIDKELAGLSLLSTPHVAGYSRNGKLNGAMMMAEIIFDHFSIESDLSVFTDELDSNISDEKPDYDNLDKLYILLKESRGIEDDSQRLTESLQQDNPATEFDKLRKKYPVKYETINNQK